MLYYLTLAINLDVRSCVSPTNDIHIQHMNQKFVNAFPNPTVDADNLMSNVYDLNGFCF